MLIGTVLMQKGEPMSNLIDREDAVISLKKELYPCESDYDEGYVAGIKKAIWVIEKWLPSAEPEIITCENCKYGDVKPIADGRRWCDRHSTYMYYCSDAEVRTDEETDIS